MSLHVDDIKNFLLVTETHNMTRASERAGLTQPTLSYSIRRLEDDLGSELFIRLKNGVRLTKLGEMFQTKAKRLLFDWEELQKLALDDSGEISGHYSFGIHPSVALYTLVEFLPDLLKENKKLEIQLFHGLSREMTERVINWELDLAIVVNPKRHPDLVIHELCQDKVGLFCVDKKKKDLLIYDEKLTQSQAILKKIKKASFIFKRSLRAENLEVIADLTSHGVGVGILPERVAKRAGNLKLFSPHYLYKDKICLVYRSEKHRDFSGREMIKCIKDVKF